MNTTVLVVDDDTDCREMLLHFLGFEGYAVVTAANGAEALRVAQAHRPRLILLDLMMPVMDGFEFRARQQSDPEISSIPVICISAMHDAARAADDLGAVGCIQKPIEVDELLRMVKARAPQASR